MVHTSTSETYGTALRVRSTKTIPLQPQSPYSASKIGADMMALQLPSRLRAAGRGRAAVQHLRPAAVGARGDPDDPRPAARRRQRDPARRHHADARLQLRRRHRRRLPRGRGLRPGRRATSSTWARARDRDRRPGRAADRDHRPRREVVIDEPTRAARRAARSNGCSATTPRAREWAGWQPEVPFEEGLRRTSDWVRDNLALVDPDRYQV